MGCPKLWRECEETGRTEEHMRTSGQRRPPVTNCCEPKDTSEAAVVAGHKMEEVCESAARITTTSAHRHL